MNSKIKEVQIEGGIFIFKLYQILEDKNISINKLMRDTNTDFKVIQRLAKGDCIRVDLAIIARLCAYLKCDFEDIIEHKRNSELIMN